jgi:imidazole glycerol phosphate synthase glutamine amidotransferase subunit
LRRRIAEGIPYFGICLGLQALFESSAEAPDVKGLGVFKGNIERFDSNVSRVPHMGWDNVKLVRSSQLLSEKKETRYFYFAHSYYVPVDEGATAICDYGVPFVAALERESVWGVQFHPEKSGALGLDLLRRFIEL